MKKHTSKGCRGVGLVFAILGVPLKKYTPQDYRVVSLVFTVLAVVFGDRNGEKISSLSQKYRLEIYDEDRNTITLSFRIFSIERHDYGKYTCVSSNTLGEDSESMVLYGEYAILCEESVP